MKKRVILVTGASRGIGAATARLFGRRGATVAVNYLHDEQGARAVSDDIRANGGRSIIVKADVRDESQVNAIVAEVTRQFGPIDTLVVNASIAYSVRPFVEYGWADFQAKVNGEMAAAFFCCKAVVGPMLERRDGCIIAISSDLSRHPAEGFCAYSAAKSGLDGFMRSLALELGPVGIRVNVVAPGLTETDATASIPAAEKEATARLAPLRRLGQPEDVAGAVLMLASDHARFLTGLYVPVSGGTLMI
jgi:3-oxoacyl-[acyl-carrier protein] reductase